MPFPLLPSLVAECEGVEPLAALLEETHAGCVMFAAQCVSAISIDGVCACVRACKCACMSACIRECVFSHAV